MAQCNNFVTPWQNRELKDKLRFILKNEICTDCSFLVSISETKEIQCHKLMLALASTVFERMFFGVLAESSNSPIRLDDIEVDIFQEFLDFIYHNEDHIEYLSEDKLKKLMGVANKYMVEQLKEKCTKLLLKRMESAEVHFDCFSFFEMGCLYESKDIMPPAANRISDLIEDKMNYDPIFDFGPHAFKELVKRIDIVAPTKFDIVHKYIHSHCILKNEISSENNDGEEHKEEENKASRNLFNDIKCYDISSEVPNSPLKLLDKEFVDDLLALINYKDMSSLEFCNGPGNCVLFTYERKYELLEAITRDSYRQCK